VSVGAILEDVVKDELVLNAALPRTVGALLFRPGHLTEEYIRGRIVRYIPPLRLYLVSSILFFLVISFIGLRALERVTTPQPAVPTNVDSARTVLQEQQADLLAVDTSGMPAAARAGVRQALSGTAAALAMLDDTAADPLVRARLQRAAAGEAPLAPGTLQPWAQGIRFSSRLGWLKAPLERKVEQLGHLPARDALITAIRDLLRFAPHMVFLLLPVFALLLKLLYVRRGRYYAEHVVFALHLHAFFFVMFLMTLLPLWSWFDWIPAIWIFLYTWLAMKRVYRQGWFRTTVKWWTLGVSYAFVLGIGLMALAVATLILT
jgi:hypothetical protein